MDPAVDHGKGNIGPHTYERIFELLLRLHANSLWPAMHPGTLAFNAVPENAKLADKWGIVMGSSHSEALLRNNVGEWDEHAPPEGNGPWNYQTNADAMNAYWGKRLEENGKYENFYTVGLRGVHDSGLEAKGTPEVKAGWNWHHRYLIGLPMIDVQSVGAGGGSIARVVSGTLKVGPESAGAVPGPVCYGRGGVEPTVTDANLVLGYLSSERFSGGQMRLDVERAHAALHDRVAGALGISVLEAAEGIFRLVNANMANAVRKVSAGRGIDPRPLVLVAFGGNGPVHAGMQARELGIRRIFVPKLAPAFSALGLLLSDHVVDEMRSYVTPVGRVDLVRANALLAEMEAAARRALGRPARFERLAALCYPGQTFDMPVPLVARNGALTPRGLADTVARFHRMHEELHTYACRDEEPILRALRVKAVATDEKPALPRAERGPAAKARAGARKAFFGGRLVPTPVYDGTKLGPGATIDGPALVDEPFTTVVVYPGQQARVDRFGNYAISVGRA